MLYRSLPAPHSLSKTCDSVTASDATSPLGSCVTTSSALSVPKMPKKSASSRSVKQRVAKLNSSSKRSRTDWDFPYSEEPGTPTPEHPEADRRYIIRGIVRKGLVPAPPKTSIALRVDSDVLEWFKAQGPGYQTRMN